MTTQADVIKAQAATIDELMSVVRELTAENARLTLLAPKVKPAYVSRPVDPEVLRRREAMAAAKAAAMSGGQAVRVEW